MPPLRVPIGADSWFLHFQAALYSPFSKGRALAIVAAILLPPKHIPHVSKHSTFSTSRGSSSQLNVMGFCRDSCSIGFAVLLPPLGVFIRTGCSCSFFLNIILTLLGYFPGALSTLARKYILRSGFEARQQSGWIRDRGFKMSEDSRRRHAHAGPARAHPRPAHFCGVDFLSRKGSSSRH